jgi:hypothetical protein
LPLLGGLSHYSQASQSIDESGVLAFQDALTRIHRLLKPGSIVVLISDFYLWKIGKLTVGKQAT